MKQSDLDILLREGEGTMLEYKEALSSAFANLIEKAGSGIRRIREEARAGG